MVKKDNSKRGWIKIVEAFTAILLIAGVFLVILDKGHIGKEDPSEKIYESELAVLRDIQSNETLRQVILSVPEALPVNSSSATFPQEINTKLNDIPNYLECLAFICELNGNCVFFSEDDKDIYAREVTISSTLTEYNPRKLKLFCWIE